MLRKVYEAVANAFIKEGTRTVFGLLGDGQMLWWSEIAKHKTVKMVDGRDEGCTLTMSEGRAMATGEVGVCSCTQGSGLAPMTMEARCRTYRNSIHLRCRRATHYR